MTAQPGSDRVNAPPPADLGAPGRDVLRAFGVEQSPRRLPGGQGTSWVAGGLVFKADGGPVQEWLGTALSDLVSAGIRLAPPAPTCGGAWVHEGWSANRWVEGSKPDYAAAATWIGIIEAGRAFHRAVAHLTRPDCLDARHDRWAMADRAVWGEMCLPLRPELVEVARRLHRAVEPLGRRQVVHGDLTGNVLVAPGLAPAVIDISPYWRPPQYAEGVVLADALCWHGASAQLLEATGVSVAAVARGLLFRIATTSEAVVCGVDGVDLQDELRRYERAAAAIGL
jgi:hypothetical protein